jgi:glycosyltransferase involved in cell wall biosynthesis
MIKIVYILEQFYLHGGVEKITAAKANYLVANGFEVTIIVNRQQGKQKVYPLNKNINFIDLAINYQQETSYFHPKNLVKAPFHILKLRKLLNKLKPNIVVMLSLQFDHYALPFITLAKTIREHHSSRYYYAIARQQTKSFPKKLRHSLDDYILNKYTHNVVLTPDEKQHYKLKNCLVIPNGIHLLKANTGYARKKIVLAAGRIAKVKNFEHLLLAWQQITTKHPDWQLEIYGGGDRHYQEKLQKQMHDLAIENTTCLCGNTTKLELKMQESAIYAMTSHTECYPMVLLEAQAAALPIISYDCPYGPRNIINEGLDGVLVENQNWKAFAIQLENLILDEAKRIEMSKNTLETVKRNQLTVIMKKWMDLFKTA